MTALRVLAVDDDANVRNTVVEVLSPDGCEVVTAEGPADVLRRLQKKEQFHILILDLKMPQMTGIELLREVRKLDKDVGVIVLTAYPSLDSATEAIDLDVSAYMQKPFSGDDIRDTVARVARKRGIVVRREDELHITIGNRIRAIRKSRGLTLKETARRTSLSVSLLSQIERAESSASVSSLFKVSSALDVRIVELFGNF